MRTARSCLFYVTLFIVTIILGFGAVAVSYLTRRPEKAHLVARLWGNLNLRAAGVRVRLKGLENLTPGKSYIFAGNHQSWFDIFAILGRLPVQFRWLAKRELFKLPFLGAAMTAIGYIPIDRGDRRRAFESINQAALKVQQGTSIVIFPEGTRSRDGVLQDFKKGGFILAIKSKQPIVPVSISGSHDILPKDGDWKICPGVIRMTIGKPIATSTYNMKNRDLLICEVRDAIKKHLTVKEGGLLPTEVQSNPSLCIHRDEGIS